MVTAWTEAIPDLLSGRLTMILLFFVLILKSSKKKTIGPPQGLPRFFVAFIFFLDFNFQCKIASLLKDLYTYSHLGLTQQFHDYTAYEDQAKFSFMGLNKTR